MLFDASVALSQAGRYEPDRTQARHVVFAGLVAISARLDIVGRFWRAARRIHVKFVPWAQMRVQCVIRLSDAVAQLESAIGDIAYRSGSEG